MATWSRITGSSSRALLVLVQLSVLTTWRLIQIASTARNASSDPIATRISGTTRRGRGGSCGVGGVVTVSVAARRSAEDLGFLGRELLVRENPLLVQRGELLQLLDRIRPRGLGLVVALRLRVAALRLAVVLLRPPVRLPARDAIADRGRCAGDHGGAGDAAKQSWHGVFLRSADGFFRVERRDDGLHGDAAAGDELRAGLAQRHGQRGGPAVLPDEHRGGGARLERLAGLLEVVVAE